MRTIEAKMPFDEGPPPNSIQHSGTPMDRVQMPIAVRDSRWMREEGV